MINTNASSFAAAVLIAAFAQGVGSACAQAPVIAVDNGFRYPLYLWIWPREGDRGWVKPAPYLTPGGSTELKLVTPGEYFLVARDKGGNDDPLGNVNLHEVVRLANGARVRIEGSYIIERKQVDVRVQRYVAEEKTRQVQRWIDGRWVQVTENYTVQMPVTETKTVIVPVRRPQLEMKIVYLGRAYSLNEFFHAVGVVAPRDQ